MVSRVAEQRPGPRLAELPIVSVEGDRGKLFPVPLPVCENLLARVPNLGCTSESPGEDSKVLKPRFPSRPVISEYLRARGRVNLERIPW